jgi:hypothetical protein
VAASLKEKAARAGSAIAGAATQAYAKVAEAARAEAGARAPRREREELPDPLAEEDAALEERFRELERKLRIAKD